MNTFFDSYKNNVFSQNVKYLLNEINFDIRSVWSEKEHELVSQKLLNIESRSRQKLSDYRKSISVSAPRGFYIKGELKKDYETYLEEIEII
ncbi:hypothetical protein ACR71G_15980, partial [Xenorhabdus bovienii]|uniref:hypothetical protein n=1 Tax=Xenorhabdus bovienii TaxID=40576 RepID=UPI003DA539F6